MRISPFRLERYFAEYEFKAPYLLCCSDCESLAVGDLLAMEPGSVEAFHSVWLGYTESQGHPTLREQIADLYDGITPDQILVHSGAEEAIFNLMNVVLNAGDHAIVHTPCYQSLFEIAKAIGCEITPWRAQEASGWALNIDDLRRNIRANTRLVVVNCPHNPTGYLIGHDAFAELIRLSQVHGFAVFSDEVYRFLEYDEADRLPAICEVDERGVSLSVMSKAYGLAGLRIGWIATRNADLLDRLAAFKDYTTICNSAPSEYLAIIALKHKRQIIERNLGLIRRNLDILDGFFGRHGDRFAWARPKAGPIAFPSLMPGVIARDDARDVARFCHDLVTRTGVLLLPGTVYGPDYQNVRIGFGRSNVGECVARLEEYLSDSSNLWTQKTRSE